MYGSTYRDRMITPPTVSWRMLRELRGSPPGPAGRGERRETFGAALEQAEQLLTAAAQVGPQSSPLLVFYGLSQGARAVAAASTAAGQGDWRLTGHGVRALRLETAAKSLAGVAVQDQGRSGAFTTVARLLGAGSLPEAVPLGRLWRLIPDVDRFPLPDAHGSPPLTVTLVAGAPMDLLRSDATVTVDIGPLPPTLAAAPAAGETDWQAGPRDWPGERTALRAHLDAYPGLSGFLFRSPEGNPVGFTGDQRNLFAPIVLPTPAGGTDPGGLDGRTVALRGERFAFPALRAGEPPQHPFTVWWAVTYALSMLARYHPREWAALVSVDTNPAATALEHLLAEALTVLPELLHRTIAEAARLSGPARGVVGCQP